MNNPPSEPGFYWAKSRQSQKRYDLIVLIQGSAPMLRIVWAFTATNSKPTVIYPGETIAEPRRTIDEDGSQILESGSKLWPEHLHFGPMLEIPPTT
jgi:hypothetical protein